MIPRIDTLLKSKENFILLKETVLQLIKSENLSFKDYEIDLSIKHFINQAIETNISGHKHLIVEQLLFPINRYICSSVFLDLKKIPYR